MPHVLKKRNLDPLLTMVNRSEGYESGKSVFWACFVKLTWSKKLKPETGTSSLDNRGS